MSKKIIIVDNSDLSYSGEDIDGTILRGTETSLILLSEQFHKMGFQIDYCNEIKEEKIVNGVRYFNKKNIDKTINYDLAIAQSFNAYLASTVHVAHAHKHRGLRWATEEQALNNMTNKVKENMTACGNFIEKHLLKGPWVLGKDYSICDPYLAVITRWFGDDNVDTSNLPRIMDHNRLIKERHSMKTVTAIHNPQ